MTVSAHYLHWSTTQSLLQYVLSVPSTDFVTELPHPGLEHSPGRLLVASTLPVTVLWLRSCGAPYPGPPLTW